MNAPICTVRACVLLPFSCGAKASRVFSNWGEGTAFLVFPHILVVRPRGRVSNRKTDVIIFEEGIRIMGKIACLGCSLRLIKPKSIIMLEDSHPIFVLGFVLFKRCYLFSYLRRELNSLTPRRYEPHTDSWINFHLPVSVSQFVLDIVGIEREEFCSLKRRVFATALDLAECEVGQILLFEFLIIRSVGKTSQFIDGSTKFITRLNELEDFSQWQLTHWLFVIDPIADANLNGV